LQRLSLGQHPALRNFQAQRGTRSAKPPSSRTVFLPLPKLRLENHSKPVMLRLRRLLLLVRPDSLCPPTDLPKLLIALFPRLWPFPRLPLPSTRQFRFVNYPHTLRHHPAYRPSSGLPYLFRIVVPISGIGYILLRRIQQGPVTFQVRTAEFPVPD